MNGHQKFGLAIYIVFCLTVCVMIFPILIGDYELRDEVRSLRIAVEQYQKGGSIDE